MPDGPLSFFESWEGFLPPNAVVMAKRRALEAPSGEATVSPAANPVSDAYRFLVEAPGISRPAERELFTKMMGALGLALTDVRFAERAADLPADAAEGGARAFLRFVLGPTESSAAGRWDEREPVPALSTYSLEAILRDPGLKKAVWAHLQEANRREGRAR